MELCIDTSGIGVDFVRIHGDIAEEHDKLVPDHQFVHLHNDSRIKLFYMYFILLKVNKY